MKLPGPLIELDRHTPALVRHRNRLPAVGPFGSPAKTSVHLHGSASLPEYDGYANDTTAVGERKDSKYPNHQPAMRSSYDNPEVLEPDPTWRQDDDDRRHRPARPDPGRAPGARPGLEGMIPAADPGYGA